MDSKLQSAHDWLEDPTAMPGGIGEKSLRHILEYASRIADRSLPKDRDAIRKAVGDINAMVNALCELRNEGKGDSPQAQSLAKSIGQKLRDLMNLCHQAVANLERSGGKKPAHTLRGKFEQAQNWLKNPGFDDKGLGLGAIQSIVDEGRRLAQHCSPADRQAILNLCDDVEELAKQLSDLVRSGQGNSPQAQEIAKALSQKLKELQKYFDKALVNRVVDDFIDITTPLKQFTEAALAPEGAPNREINFNDKAHNLSNFSKRASQTARNVASSAAPNKRLAEGLMGAANQVESLCPQLINGGKIRLDHPDNKAADEHFENLRKEYADSIQRMRNLVDEAIDTIAFIKASGNLRLHYKSSDDLTFNINTYRGGY